MSKRGHPLRTERDVRTVIQDWLAARSVTITVENYENLVKRFVEFITPSSEDPDTDD